MMGRAAQCSMALALALVPACYEGSHAGDDGEDGSAADDAATSGADTEADDGSEGASAGDSGEDGSTGEPGEDGPRPIVYATVGELFTQAMAPTCSPNVGVCHNSDAFPDLHTVANLVSMIDQPCNASAETHEEVHDFCELPGDRLVFPGLGIDVEIARVLPEPVNAAWGEITSVRIELMGEMPMLPAIDEADVEIHRDDEVIALGAGGAFVGDAENVAVTLDLVNAQDSVRQFLDDRIYPWDELLVRVADTNGNGTAGYIPGAAMIVPGDPMKSYLVLRLFDAEYGDVMPRQCREWNDEATRALGCFVAGLTPDTDALAIRDDDPIVYDGCDFDPIGLGICGTGNTASDIVARSCGGSTCHIGEDLPAAGLDLSEGAIVASLVDRPSTQRPERQLVVPGDPDASYLMCKLKGTCDDRIGARMPVGAPLAAEDIAVIEAWIEDGAMMDE
jgi:hypothetical protein